ncbi:MAG: hypothetical protein PUD97_02770 [Paludibacteraceae bacterium]|nr:hypothetical protein [Paludibacteraceae bacterium]
MATKKRTTKKSEVVYYSHKEANDVQEKLRVAIRAATKLAEKKNLNPAHARKVQHYRKKLQEANEWFSWNVAIFAIDTPKNSRKKS